MPEESISTKVGRLLRDERIKRGISQEKLAESAGLHRTYVGMIERGEKNITLLKLSKVAAALEISLVELFARI